MRQWLVLSTTTAPASTKRGAHSELTAPPAEERTTVEALDRLFVQRPALQHRAVPLDLAAGRALRGEGHHLGGGELAPGEGASIVAPTAPVAPSTSYPVAARD